MKYEVVNSGSNLSPLSLANGACAGADSVCGGLNGVCGSVDVGCAGIDFICFGDTDPSCDGGNVFPCENPGFGCRSGCGGSKWSNCIGIKSV